MIEPVPYKRKLPVFSSLLLIPAIFIFHNLNLFRELLFYDKVIALCSVYLLLPLCLYACFRKLFKLPVDISALAVVLLTFLFFFFGALQDFLAAYTLTRFLGKTYILPFLFIGPSLYLMVRKNGVQKLLNSLFVALSLFLAGEILVLLFSLPHFRKEQEIAGNTSWAKKGENKANDTLHIYHIIFDSYASSTALQTLFQFKIQLTLFCLAMAFMLPVAQRAIIILHRIRLPPR